MRITYIFYSPINETLSINLNIQVKYLFFLTLIALKINTAMAIIIATY